MEVLKLVYFHCVHDEEDDNHYGLLLNDDTIICLCCGGIIEKEDYTIIREEQYISTIEIALVDYLEK